ncbi:hypothetical protein [Lentzea aerocolonigenes]|uniref:hypothetical protein n=1 Tax=Lentzea aerocolonigenes TaxID=68170 RepID=UPI000AFEEA90|nr:hypothetical protein [Lentzea aerocolonigenes]
MISLAALGFPHRDNPHGTTGVRAAHVGRCVLLKVYAKVMDGQRDTSNQKITELLGEPADGVEDEDTGAGGSER